MPRPLGNINKLDPAELKLLKKRIDIATAVMIFFLAVLIVRLWNLQIRHGEEYAKLSESNRIRVQAITAPRGNILDRNGNPIVTNRPRFNVVWIREDAPHPDEVIKRLAKILDLTIPELLDRIRAGADHPRYVPTRLKEDVDWKTLVYIENNSFNLPGVQIEVLPSRDYLYGSLAAHLVGYLGEINQRELETLADQGYQPGDLIGKMGMEKLFDKKLKGEKGRQYVEVDVRGFAQKLIRIQEPLPGNDLQLTIDTALQQTAEQALDGKAGAIVVMEVATGRVLAMVSAPTLPLTEFVGGIASTTWQRLLNDPKKPLLNKPIQGQYPPGSTYKIVTALAGLAEQVVTPATVFYCNGSYTFGNRSYGCWKKSGHGAVDLKKALAESCDVYFYQVGQRLGVDTLAKYARMLGLGEKTGIAMEHEKEGLVPTSEWKRRRFKEPWQEGETLSIAIGQGFNLATPLQICRMTAAVANGGTLFSPRIVDSIRDPDGKVIEEFPAVATATVLAGSDALKTIQDALVEAVHGEHGTGKAARIKGVTIAGKTGTAQVVKLSQFEEVPEEQIPYRYRDHAWFTCYAPAEAPEIAVTVLVEHGGHGGSAAAPIAREILKKYFELHPPAVTAAAAANH